MSKQIHGVLICQQYDTMVSVCVLHSALPTCALCTHQQQRPHPPTMHVSLLNSVYTVVHIPSTKASALPDGGRLSRTTPAPLMAAGSPAAAEGIVQTQETPFCQK